MDEGNFEAACLIRHNILERLNLFDCCISNFIRKVISLSTTETAVENENCQDVDVYATKNEARE